MAEVQIRDILVGYGDLYYADYDTALPTWDVGSDTLRTDFDDDANWTYAGATQEGVEIAYAPEYGEVNVDQLGDAAVMFFDTASVTLNTQLAEATLTNLLFAWGFADDFLVNSSDTDTFSIGVPGQDPVERAVAVVGKGAEAPSSTPSALVTRERVYHGRRALSIEGSSLAMRRNENTAYQVSLRLLPDSAYPGEEYGVIIDRVPGDVV
ncbi:MAG: hypothetical protein LC650_00950 [Actinobacteria bacterium]|nr:hypothetical protein [Actinomycetota bacterium]